MARVKDNPITEGVSGKLGRRLVFRHMKDGRTIIATRPDYTGHKWTPDQQTHHTRFQEAAAYARVASKTNPLYTQLATGTTKNAYNLALSDWFHAPAIHQVQWHDDRIRVQATDNVQVTRVLITISDEHGNTLERGEAVLAPENWWEYKPAAQGSLFVQAFDLPGNVAKANAAAQSSSS